MRVRIEFAKHGERKLTETQIESDFEEYDFNYLQPDLGSSNKIKRTPTFNEIYGYEVYNDIDYLNSKKQQELINEFYDYVNDGHKPYFKFVLIDGKTKLFNNVVEFLQHIGKLKYTEVTVIPF